MSNWACSGSACAARSMVPASGETLARDQVFRFEVQDDQISASCWDPESLCVLRVRWGGRDYIDSPVC